MKPLINLHRISRAESLMYDVKEDQLVIKLETHRNMIVSALVSSSLLSMVGLDNNSESNAIAKYSNIDEI